MVLGVVVLVIAIFALRDPKGHVTTAGPSSGGTTTVVRTAQASPADGRSSTTSPSAGPSSNGSSSDHSSSTGSSSTGSSSSATGTGAGSVPLIVLNDTTTSGLANKAAKRFENGGWTVNSHGNLPSNITNIISTCAYYDPNVTGTKNAAKALQQQYPTIKRVQPKFAELPSGPLVVVLAQDYSSN